MSAPSFLYVVPWPLQVVLVVGLAALLAVAGVLLVRRTVPLPVLEANNEFKDLIVGGIGIFYAVLLAFVVLTVWEQYRETQRIVEGEANKLGDILRNVQGLPDPFRRQVQQQVHDYAGAVVEEWEDTAWGRPSARAEAAFDRLWLLYQSYSPEDAREVAIYAEGLSRLSELREQRRLRLLSARETVPGLLWFVLLAGGAVTVGSTFFFGLRNLWAQVVLTVMLAAMIALSLLVIFAFDQPFAGDIRVTSEAFQRQVEEAERFMRGS